MVASVTSADRPGGAPDQVTAYDYLPAAWHFDEDGLTGETSRTWSQWWRCGRQSGGTDGEWEVTKDIVEPCLQDVLEPPRTSGGMCPG
ncbi:hypothetical protein [Streptomyces sp. NPDC101237]|uniref:hypothetical protein n=1 Tax=Streptomyces sp. NPDC101237 TaxID=3366139 RepID=UPI00382969A1